MFNTLTQCYMHLPSQAIQALNTVIQSCTNYSPDILHLLRLLLANQQGGQLAQMTVSPDQPALCRTLTALVIHTAAVLLTRANDDLLLPFVNMLNNPSVLGVSINA